MSMKSDEEKEEREGICESSESSCEILQVGDEVKKRKCEFEEGGEAKLARGEDGVGEDGCGEDGGGEDGGGEDGGGEDGGGEDGGGEDGGGEDGVEEDGVGEDGGGEDGGVEDGAKAKNPANFYLSKVISGIDEAFNNECTLSIGEMLSDKWGKLKESCQFNYLIDIDWLLDQYQPDFRGLPLTIVGQERDRQRLSSQAAGYPNVSLCLARLADSWGTHHSKMMLLLYETGLRVAIHTANLVEQDWAQKTQGIWLSELLPRLDQQESFRDESAAGFQTDLIEYLQAYRAPALNRWAAVVKRHRFGSVRVALVGSVPGRHRAAGLHRFGHLKLRRLLADHCQADADWPLVAQFSSIGSLGGSPTLWLTGEFRDSLQTRAAPTGRPLGPHSAPPLRLVFPSVEDVRGSLEGYPAGGSLPYSRATAARQPYLAKLMHRWKSDAAGRSRAQPHVKTYCRLSGCGDRLGWLLLTSANLSKAAWGCLEKGGSQLNIRSFEIGVLFLPKLFGPFSSFRRSAGLFVCGDGVRRQLSLPLPFDWPLLAYQQSDEPWIIDLPHKKPDSHGNIWEPC